MAAEPDFDVVLGPLGAAGLLALGRAAGKRSLRALAFGVAALVLETRWRTYQRFKANPRYSDLNLVMVRLSRPNLR